MQLLRGARRKTARPNLSRPRTQNRPRLPGALHAGRRKLRGVNLGTNAYIAGLLAMYKVPVTCLQTIKQPVSHRAAGLLRNLFHGLKRDFIGTPQVPPQLPKVFAEYIELLEDGGAANQPQLNFSEEAEGE